MIDTYEKRDLVKFDDCALLGSLWLNLQILL